MNRHIRPDINKCRLRRGDGYVWKPSPTGKRQRLTSGSYRGTYQTGYKPVVTFSYIAFNVPPQWDSTALKVRFQLVRTTET